MSSAWGLLAFLASAAPGVPAWVGSPWKWRFSERPRGVSCFARWRQAGRPEPEHLSTP